MIGVTTAFKNEMKSSAKEIRAYITDGTTQLNENDGLHSIVIEQESAIARVVMRRATVKHYGSTNYLDKLVNLGLGVVLPDTTVEYIDYGKFKVVEREVKKGDDVITLKLYDQMYESLLQWDLDPIYDITYPTTLKGLLEAICTRFSWTLKTVTFPNHDTAINGDDLTGVVDTFRDVLEMIAEASGSVIYFDVDDELVVGSIEHTTVADTLDADDLNSLDVEAEWGEVNSIVLARVPQEDNIVQKDDTSIANNGLTELKFSNNWIMDGDRETWITDIYNEFLGLKFYPFKAEESGLGYFQITDRIRLQDPQGNNFDVVVLGIKTEITGGFKETLWAEVPDKSSTKYQYAGIIGRTIKNTEIIVDKQKGEIILVNEALNESISQITQTTDSITASVNNAIAQGDANSDAILALEGDITELQIRADGIEIAVSGIGGTNLLKNSVGLKGEIRDWQEFDSEGSLVDARNTGTIDNSTSVEINSESGSAILLDNEYIKQTFPTIQGQTYTFYCRYKSNATATLDITGLQQIILPIEADWTVYKVQFTAVSDTATLRIENDTDGDNIRLTDNVIKLGDVAGWIQAPNEVYGANFRFDKDGFEITSLTDDFKSILDNQKLAVYDTSGGSDKIVMLVSKDEGKITKLTAQDEFVVQRYENSDASARFIPVSDGLMLVINNN